MLDDKAIQSRLVNWARWSRSGKSSARTKSAEGRYRPEMLRDGEEAERRSASVPIDVRDALAVQRALCPTRGFPVKLRLLLSAEYIYRMDVPKLQGYMRRHGHGGINARDVDSMIVDAVCAASNAMRRSQN